MANTVTLREALMKLADDVGETRSAFIRSVSSQTVLLMNGISMGQTSTFKYALARSYGKGVRQVTGYVDTNQQVTVASSFDSNVSAGDLVDIAWWEADKASMGVQSINEAIRLSFPYYYREIKTGSPLTGTIESVDAGFTGTNTRFLDELQVGDYVKLGSQSQPVVALTSQTVASFSDDWAIQSDGQTACHASGLTYTTGTHVYRLPSTVHDLIAIGWTLSSSDPISWIPPLSGWRVTGTEGAYNLHFFPGQTWAVDGGSVGRAFASPVVRGGTYADLYNGKEIHLHYLSREPELTSLTDVCNLPLQYFAVASEIYMQRRLAMVDPESEEGRRLNASYALVREKAIQGKEWLRYSKQPLATLKGPQLELI